jgi:hypothetical protein
LEYRKLSVVTSSVRGRCGHCVTSAWSSRAVVDFPTATLQATAMMNGAGRICWPRNTPTVSRNPALAWK